VDRGRAAERCGADVALAGGVGNLAAAERRRQREFSPSYKAPARRSHHDHEGIDIAAPEGSAIRAVQNGLVVYSDNALTGYGNLVIVLHKDGSVALYAHCRSTFVFAGQRVERGQVLGEIGHTGFAQGPHLHFEYRVNGYARDPLEHFNDDFIARSLAAISANANTKKQPAR
jgi:murein DD-endopeptidase MepM/ murein hydrolase activator NlpD